jgi:hypothetical protein
MDSRRLIPNLSQYYFMNSKKIGLNQEFNSFQWNVIVDI